MRPAGVAALAMLGFGFAFILAQNADPYRYPHPKHIAVNDSDTYEYAVPETDPIGESAPVAPEISPSPEVPFPGAEDVNYFNAACWEKYKSMTTNVVCFPGFKQTKKTKKNCTEMEMHTELSLYRIWLRLNDNCKTGSKKEITYADLFDEHYPESGAEIVRLEITDFGLWPLVLHLALAMFN